MYGKFQLLRWSDTTGYEVVNVLRQRRSDGYYSNYIDIKSKWKIRYIESCQVHKVKSFISEEQVRIKQQHITIRECYMP